MKSKTLKLIDGFMRIIKEEGEMPDMSQEQPPAPQEGSQPEPEAGAQETMPLSSTGEDTYISDIINAAIFKPSAEQLNTLDNLRKQMDMKKYTNAKEEILPSLLAMIPDASQENVLKDKLNQIN